MNKSKIKVKGWALAVLAMAVTLVTEASDINKGYTFAPAEKNVTHTKLNNLVDLATINSSFITDKSVAAPSSADSFLFYSASSAGMRRSSFDTMFLSNTNLIFSQTEASPGTNDYILLLSSTTGLFAKSSLSAVLLTNNFLIPGQTEATNPLPANAQFLVTSNGVYYRVGLSNVFREWWRYMVFSTNTYYDVTPTNTSLLTLYTTPTNADQLLIWDAHNGTNKAITLASLMTNAPAVAATTNTDSLLLFSTVTNAANPYGTNPVFSKITLGQLAAHVNSPGGTNQIAYTNQLPITFTSATQAVTMGTITLTHGLMAGTNNVTPQLVRWVLVCVTAQLGFSVGDEIDCTAVATSTGSADNQNYQYTANTTNVVLHANNDTVAVRRNDTGGLVTITTADWRLKCYATYFPQ